MSKTYHEQNRTVEYLKKINKYSYIPLPEEDEKNPTNRRPDINLLYYNSYESYKREQCKRANAKRNIVWEDEPTIEKLMVKMRARSPLPFERGLVHGVRNGKFTNWIYQSLGIDIISTELSPAVSSMHRFTIDGGWDFHEVKPEWLNSFDFVWGGSLHHSYDPYKCLQKWMSCVKHGPTGQMIITHLPPGSTCKAMERDICFTPNMDELINLINAAGRDNRNKYPFHVETVWNKADGVSWDRVKFKRYIVVVPTL